MRTSPVWNTVSYHVVTVALTLEPIELFRDPGREEDEMVGCSGGTNNVRASTDSISANLIEEEL